MKVICNLHSTRVKEKLISKLPGLQAHKRGKQVILTRGEVTREAALSALGYSDNDDGKALVQAAKLIRPDLFNNENEFKFNYDKDSQKNSVPMSLIMLLQMILEGTNVSLLDDNKTRDTAVGLSQLVKFNVIIRKREQSVLHVRHKNPQETPLIASTKFNQLSRKTYANNIVLKKQCARTH